MRILHVYKDFDPPVRGGIERHVALMCRYQSRWADVEALVCSRCARTRTVVKEGVRVTEVAEWGRFQSAPVSPLFPLYLKRRPADVVVIHVPNPTAELSWLLTRPRGALVARYHSDVVRQAAAMKIYRPFLQAFLSLARAVVPTSHPYVDTSPILQQLEKNRPGRIHVVPLGIVPEEFQHPDADRVAALRRQYGGKEGRYVFFSGIHRYYKGLEFLVRAAPEIRAPVVIGGDGPETPKIRRLARVLAVPVHFTGPLDFVDLVDHLQGCAAFVFPSVERSEAFGLSILEAQACGKPVVATRLGTGVEYANLDGETGYNVAPRDPQALAAAVNRLLEDADLACRLGAFGRARVYREFTAEAAAKREFELYRELVDER